MENVTRFKPESPAAIAAAKRKAEAEFEAACKSRLEFPGPPVDEVEAEEAAKAYREAGEASHWAWRRWFDSPQARGEEEGWDEEDLHAAMMAARQERATAGLRYKVVFYILRGFLPQM